MDDSSLEKMMQNMISGKKEFLVTSIIIYTILLSLLILILLGINRFTGTWNLKPIVLKILAGIFMIGYIYSVTARWHRYKYGYKNQPPWHGGIYEGYYECQKCKSLSGGIFGKGPTRHKKYDTGCVHDWQAIHKEIFEEKFAMTKNPNE